MGGANDLFGQLWKEYAMSDSRYLTSEPFVLCMETITAVSHDRLPRRFTRLIHGADLLGPAFIPHGLLNYSVLPNALSAASHSLVGADVR